MSSMDIIYPDGNSAIIEGTDNQLNLLKKVYKINLELNNAMPER
jgi:hypothetical protein